MGDDGTVAGLSPELVASLVLRRAHDGGVAKVGDRYLDGGHPTPGYLAGAFDELINAGLLAIADADPYGFRRVSVTETGRTRYAQLRDTRQSAGLWVPEPRFPTTGPTAVGRRSSTPSPAVGGTPDPIRGCGPAMHWARCPAEGRVHAIEPTDTEQAAARGIGVTTDMPDPGRMGTTQ